MIIDTIENAGLYRGLGRRIGTALELAVAGAWRGNDSGRHDVEGDLLFYLVQSYTTKPREGRSWESHRAYVDVQCIVQGEELTGWSPISRLSLTQPYDATSDAARYSGTGDLLTVRAGMFVIFWPEDGHLPAIASGAPSVVRKVVFKAALRP